LLYTGVRDARRDRETERQGDGERQGDRVTMKQITEMIFADVKAPLTASCRE
jgi:hypothetical protein